MDNRNIVMDEVGEGFEDSDGCYSSFEDDWDDCNGENGEDNFGMESDDGVVDERMDNNSPSIMHVSIYY